MQVLSIGQIPPEHKKADRVSVMVDSKKYTLRFAKQKTGFGAKSLFFCPVCERRCTKLYFDESGFRCATCGKINQYADIQNSTKGGEREIRYRMMRFAAASGIVISEWPFNYKNYVNDKRIKTTAFRRKLAILQALENMRGQNIFFKTTYKPETIRAVLRGNHPILKKTNLQELQQYFWSF